MRNISEKNNNVTVKRLSSGFQLAATHFHSHLLGAFSLLVVRRHVFHVNMRPNYDDVLLVLSQPRPLHSISVAFKCCQKCLYSMNIWQKYYRIT